MAKKALELIDANPDFVYEPPGGRGCVYVHEGKGSCLFGQALEAVGFDFPAEWEDKAVTQVLQRIFDPEADYDVGHLTAYLRLEEAQSGQDEGQEWGSDEVRGRVVEFIEANS